MLLERYNVIHTERDAQTHPPTHSHTHTHTHTQTQFDPTLSWADVEWIKKEWGGKLVIKGSL